MGKEPIRNAGALHPARTIGQENNRIDCYRPGSHGYRPLWSAAVDPVSLIYTIQLHLLVLVARFSAIPDGNDTFLQQLVLLVKAYGYFYSLLYEASLSNYGL